MRAAQEWAEKDGGLLSMLGLLMPAQHAAAQAGPASSDQDLIVGRSAYIASCARCHGVEGGGGEGPPLARARLPRAPDDAALIAIMVNGIPGSGMSGSWFLSEDELRAIAGYVRSLAPTGADQVAHLTGDPGARPDGVRERGM